MANEVDSKNIRGLILVWAFAESGIGGMLHALRLPFTGILVGGIAVICIALMGYYTVRSSRTILSALTVVLLVKLTVSPHSPWQAYVAVAFQGLTGALIFSRQGWYKTGCLVFSIICLLESALQKILLTIIIYGTQLMGAIDKAAIALAGSFGIRADGSLVMLVFGIYVLLHLLTGVLIGLWLPSIPKQLEDLHMNLPEVSQVNTVSQKQKRNTALQMLIGLGVLIIVLLAIKVLVPQMPLMSLVFIFIRSVAVSLGLIFIAGPLLVSLIRRFAGGHSGKAENQILTDTLDEIPDFTRRAYQVASWSGSSFKGLSRVRHLILGLLHLSLYGRK